MWRLCQHLSHSLARAKKDAARIHSHKTLPVLETGFQERAYVADACIINQDIEPSFESGDLLYGSLHLRFFGNVKRLYPRAPSRFLNLTRNLLRRVFSQVG